VKGVMLLTAGVISAAVAFATNWLALIPWRRAKDRHWTERARVYHPVRVAAASNLFILPAVLTMTDLLIRPDESPYWALTVLVTAVGAIAGTIPMDREVFPRIPLCDLFRQVAVSWLLRFSFWFVFLAATALMPDEFNQKSVLIAAAVLTLCIVWNRDGWIRVGRKIGLFLPPPERLQNIVKGTAARMDVSFREIWLMRISLAQAFAMPSSRRLLFSERLLQLLSDGEIAAVCAHELAHLTEPRKDYYKRCVSWLVFLPWVFFKPMVHAFGVFGFFLLLLITTSAPILYRRLSHKLETRADRMAQSNELDAGNYARALALLYEDSLVPAVLAKERATHPHLYDRLLAAGVSPDFPRPTPAHSMAWHGILFSGALGLLAMILIMRMGLHF
jgi:Zn-dependent protease with chaperone function